MGRLKRIDTWHGRRGEQDDCWIRAGEGILLASGMLSRQTSFTIFCLLLRSLECIHHELVHVKHIMAKLRGSPVEACSWPGGNHRAICWPEPECHSRSAILSYYTPFLTLLVVFGFSYVPYIYVYIIYLTICIIYITIYICKHIRTGAY